MASIRAFGDNWIHIFECEPGKALVVDPGESKSVLEFLEEKKLELATLLLTHHHLDHVGGVPELKEKTGCQVVGADASRIKGLDRLVCDGEKLEMGGVTFEVIATPGHTSTSVCYYSADIKPNGVVFTGDTLFIGGCGRLFEGSGAQMFHALSRLAQLPDETLVYCGHDYTVENLEFAQTIEPENDQICEQLKRARQQPLYHSTMRQEKLSNVFVRAGSVQEFVRRRKLKDMF
ncbi:MAG: hydroxyacylglutathione hydrolase [Phycisphaeraceae bacterium]|nr:hydroxyacylglutathione hydrolase [Phycisphaeraceae bacterium]